MIGNMCSKGNAIDFKILYIGLIRRVTDKPVDYHLRKRTNRFVFILRLKILTNSDFI